MDTSRRASVSYICIILIESEHCFLIETALVSLSSYKTTFIPQGLFDMTTHKGFRWNTATAYLRPALERPQKNLEVESKVLVTKILFDGKKAIGIEYIQNGATKKAFAENEVIISGGAINSPQLLMLSGIGKSSQRLTVTKLICIVLKI